MKTTRRARELRREPTHAERLLWSRLRAGRLQGAKFKRQFPISGFITDFCCLEHRLVIELDGGQHAEAIDYDTSRTRVLARAGYRVLRFWDNEALSNMEGVLLRIMEALSERVEA